MIRIFTHGAETLIVGLDNTGSVIDPDGILSNPNAMPMDEYDQRDFDPSCGQVLSIASSSKSENRVDRLISRAL